MSLSERDLTSPLGIQQYLQDRGWTGPSCEVERLAGGFSGFVFRARISNENDDGPSTIIVKHVAGYAARWPEFKIGQDRMRFEAKALEYLGRTYATRHPAVRIPAVLSFDQKNHLLIIQDAGDLPSLKSWLQADSPQDQITAISSALGAFLADVHNTASQDSDLRQAFNTNTNTVARNLSSSVYFGNLPAAAKKYGHNSQFIVEAAKAAEAQVLDADEVWTLGDFWPGNVLVSVPNEHTELSMTLVDFELAKPGTAAFDIGQMGAEMLCLARFRDSERNRLLLLEEFFRCYKARRQGSVDAAEVAIRIGAHLFTMMPKAWTAEAGEEKVKKLLREGFDLLKMGWENDEAALKNSIVRELMD